MCVRRGRAGSAGRAARGGGGRAGVARALDGARDPRRAHTGLSRVGPAAAQVPPADTTIDIIYLSINIIVNWKVKMFNFFRINYVDENMTKNISELLPDNLPSDIDDDMKLRIVREGLELLYSGNGEFGYFP